MKYCAKICIIIFLFTSHVVFSQTRPDALKRQAVSLMNEGRVKEAIDQLNKYVTSNPRTADGYHLRGLCFEKTTEFQYSVLDLRRARRLDPNNPQIKKDLDRVLAIWHEQLYQKITGHKRDIAIDPKNPFSYLEIGKCYRWLEEWNDAEIWYDEYLARDDNASPDEIIRYTEILAKTGSITKGEKILKKYVDRYPEDWRLWSRYGYFTLWLSKFKIAEDAFLKALSFKPFFKEAQDGLDLSRNQAYLTLYQPRSYEKVYPIDRYYNILEKSPTNDEIRFKLVDELVTANRFEEAFNQLQFLRDKYSEDERYKMLLTTVSSFRDSVLNERVINYTDSLKTDPNNKTYVLQLAETYSGLYYYDNAIEILEEYLSAVPEGRDPDLRFKLAQYNAWNYEWEKAIAILKSLLEADPENLDYQLLRGQIGVWTVLDFDIAENYLLNVVNKRPKQLPAYISLTSMYCWKKNFPEARKYLDIAKTLAPLNSPEIEEAENNFALHLSAYEEQKVFEIRMEAGKIAAEGNCQEALVKFEEYKSKRTALSFEELKEYASYASCAGDYNRAIEIYDTMLAQQFDYDIALNRARNLFNIGDTTQAFTELERLSKLNPDNQGTLLYLADAYSATNQFEKAELIYRELRYKSSSPDEREMLFDDYDYYSSRRFEDRIEQIQNDTLSLEVPAELKNQVDEHMLYLADLYIKAKMLPEAEDIYDELSNTSTNENVKKELPIRKMYLGDAYTLQEEYGTAEDIYSDLLETATDTSEIRMLNERIGWMPPYGFGKGISSVGFFFTKFIPTNIGISPVTNFYRDNQDFSLWNYGLRIDAGFIGFLGIGASWTRTNLNTPLIDRYFTSMKGAASIFFSKYLSASGSYGILKLPGEPDKHVGDVTIRLANADIYSLVGYYEKNDARLLLFSPSLILVSLNSELYRLSASYEYRKTLRLSGYYSYYKISDGNYGNDLQLRFGKRFIENGIFGYEYYFSDFAFVSSNYYSPQKFDSHSLWGEYAWSIDEEINSKIGGKIGYVPSVDFIISEIYGEINIKPVSLLNIVGRLGFSNSFRYDSSYKSFSAMLSAYWSIY